jgi:lipoprotein-anchoring transpeptidase ErfK/SrfK
MLRTSFILLYLVLQMLRLPNVACAQITGRTADAAPPHRIAQIKQLLYERGFWITRIDSIRDAEYNSALSAFRKVEGLQQSKSFDNAQLERLRASNRPIPHATELIYQRKDTERAHLEVDLKRQVLFLVDSFGRVTRILPVSSGSGKPFSTIRPDGTSNTRNANTPKGQYRITRKIRGWRKSELGMLYYPLYYRGGAAVHGANSVPNYPASHGCVRIPMYAAAAFSEMTPVGFPILVY